MAKLPTPRLMVFLGDDPDADDLEPIAVQTINADMVLMETTARKHNWGSMQEAPMKSLTFLAYAALKRRGTVNGETFEQFEAKALAVTSADDGEAVPTRPGPGPG